MPTLAELLNAEAVKQLTAIAAEAREVAADRPKAIRRPSTKKHQPRLTCSAEELVAADKERSMPKPERNNVVNLSHLTDAELGRLMRAGDLSLVVDQLPEARARIADAKSERAAQDAALLKAELDARSDADLLPGFTVGRVEVPALDLRMVNLAEVSSAIARSPYNKARYATGTELLGLDTTWSQLADEHRRLAPSAGPTIIVTAPKGTGAPVRVTPVPLHQQEVIPNAVLTDTQIIKVKALARVKGISEAAALTLLAELEG
jgi:hypothetical protein